MNFSKNQLCLISLCEFQVVLWDERLSWQAPLSTQGVHMDVKGVRGVLLRGRWSVPSYGAC